MTKKPCSRAETGYNDFVEDTPIQNGPSSKLIGDCRRYLDGGEAPLDSCPGLPGKDALFNFLNYAGNDECLDKEGSFTCGQKERMWKHWILFRDQVTSCEDPDDMEIEVSFVFDESYEADNKFRLTNKDGDVIFDSVRDHWVAYLVAKEESLYIDVCVPRNTDYELQILDRGRNGFSNGNILVFTDRAVTQRVQGNFGDKVRLKIPSRPPKTPSVAPSLVPTFVQSKSPSLYPTQTARPTQSVVPTAVSSSRPSVMPSSSQVPSARQSIGPSPIPSTVPSGFPTSVPSGTPSAQASLPPSGEPTFVPSDVPTVVMSISPTAEPSYAMTSDFPSTSPSGSPTNEPTPRPSSLIDALVPVPAPAPVSTVTFTRFPSKAKKSDYIFVPVTLRRDGSTDAPLPMNESESNFIEASETTDPPSSSGQKQPDCWPTIFLLGCMLALRGVINL